MFNRTNCDRKAQFSGILTEPLNPRDRVGFRLKLNYSQSLPLTFVTCNFDTEYCILHTFLCWQILALSLVYLQLYVNVCLD